MSGRPASEVIVAGCLPHGFWQIAALLTQQLCRGPAFGNEPRFVHEIEQNPSRAKCIINHVI